MAVLWDEETDATKVRIKETLSQEVCTDCRLHMLKRSWSFCAVMFIVGGALGFAFGWLVMGVII